MNPLAANRTAARPPRPVAIRCTFVEDLNWPGARPEPDPRKARTTPVVWVPGRDGRPDGVAPTLQ